jgi:hypothetical protein
LAKNHSGEDREMANDEKKKIGISTGGGDCPGLNAVIRAVVYTAINNYGWEVIGIKDSFNGLIYPDQIMPLGIEHVRDILHKGGTIIGTTNRGNPFLWERPKKDGTVEIVDYSDRVMENFEHLGLDALVVVGGDGSMKIAQQFFEKGFSSKNRLGGPGQTPIHRGKPPPGDGSRDDGPALGLDRPPFGPGRGRARNPHTRNPL